jgi:heme/copper-type cytochrome/quinol oxidase subunit 3
MAGHAVPAGATAGGPNGAELFDLRNVALETAWLLLSSFSRGLASIDAPAHRGFWFHGVMAATFMPGAAFLAIEIHQLAGMIARGVWFPPPWQNVPLTHMARRPIDRYPGRGRKCARSCWPRS